VKSGREQEGWREYLDEPSRLFWAQNRLATVQACGSLAMQIGEFLVDYYPN
jgi:hypothetical protein